MLARFIASENVGDGHAGREQLCRVRLDVEFRFLPPLNYHG